MNITASTALADSVSAADPEAGSSVSVAARALSQIREDGAAALALIQSSAAPPTGDHRGQLVNVMA
jgi:hypothetical protein